MMSFHRMFTSILLALAYASFTQARATATPNSAKPSTHGLQIVRRGVEIVPFHPETNYEVFGEGVDGPPSFTGELSEDAIAFVQSKLGVQQQDIAFKGGYFAGVEKYAYAQQVHDGVPFANAVANVAWKENKVISFGSSFVKPSTFAESKPTLDINSAIAKAEEVLEGKHNGHPPGLEYLARPDGSAALVHTVQVQNDETDTWFEAFIDAHSGDILSVTDFMAEAGYNVLPIEKQILPDGQEHLTDPQDPLSSPFGWHSDGVVNTTSTAGNNVVAFKGAEDSTTNESATGLEFSYSYNDTIDPAVQSNVDAARVNAFYVINTVHDFSYRYGFTETAFNFQNNNFGKGGNGNDRVLMSVQDGSGTNNANFATPPDGQAGRCRMYIWTRTNVSRDGSLENDIIVHEMTHGISNRMTGGGTGRCLQTLESRGLGEGWSDAMAEWTQQKSANITDFVLGHYVINKPGGIRTHPYSTSNITNPLTYKDINGLTGPHPIGEIWANTLHNVYAALVATHGFSTTAKTNPEGTEGNIVFLHLFLDALALQPCNPTFVDARAAWIQADQSRYNGTNKCLLWTAFASRGLGEKAQKVYENDFTVPEGC